MLNHTKKIKEIYEDIQRKLLYMIPEKWESLYLYSSVIENGEKEPTGELFFYYIPKGIFRKNPVNVYEVPSKFNIEEKQYLDLVEKLYDDIKLLREEFKKSTIDEMWSNITISINNMKFRTEYSYEDLVNNAFNSYERHVIWRYKYLGIGPEQVSKKDKEILFRYFNGARSIAEVEEYSAGIYMEQDTKNIIEYNTQEDELENDGYIKEDEVDENIEPERKYNQIKSTKIENDWYSRSKKKEETMWSHNSKSAKQYIIKPSKKHKNKEKIRPKDNLTIKPQNTINKNAHNTTMRQDIVDKTIQEKMREIQKDINKKKINENKDEKINKKTSRLIRNQILFSEDEIDDEE